MSEILNSSDTPEKLTITELIDCLCDAAWSHDKDDRMHYSSRILTFVEKLERELNDANKALENAKAYKRVMKEENARLRRELEKLKSQNQPNQ